MKNIRLLDLTASDEKLSREATTDPISALLYAKRLALRGACNDAIAILEEALSPDSLNYSLFAHNIGCWMIEGTGCSKDTIGGENLLRSALAFAKRHNLDISSDILLDLAYYLETEQIEPKDGLSRREEFIRCAIFANFGNPLWMILHTVLRNIGLAEYMPSASLRFYEHYKGSLLEQV
ncbi:hypothetical protein ABMX90_14530 [Vibrio vulnificus]|uniref:hypothetical protein n=1 Tax=Vibrio vulnificus TaxID=672 RepID=UPI0040584309